MRFHEHPHQPPYIAENTSLTTRSWDNPSYTSVNTPSVCLPQPEVHASSANRKMSDIDEANGSPIPPTFRRLRLADLQNFCLGPNSRERVLGLFEKTTAGELLQQTAAAADALALQQEASTAADKEAVKNAASLAIAEGDDDAAKDLQQLLDLLLKAIKRCFEVEELRNAILAQPEVCCCYHCSFHICCCTFAADPVC